MSVQLPSSCPTCNGTGSSTPVNTCPTCGGSGRLTQKQKKFGGFFTLSSACPDCKGTGYSGTLCSTCGGSGKVSSTKTINLRIPAGVEEGRKLRLKGLGEPGERGAPPGDLYIIIRIEPHPYFRREELNIISDIEVPFTIAALGGEVNITTIHGNAKLRIPPGISPNQILRMRKQGIRTKDGAEGDHLIKVNITVPKSLSPEQRQILERLHKELYG
ncbi:MAG: J domain-containing protein [Planctomycetota bacterium]|nr:J domain-containing protein [Planctomycetota bacterium]